MTDFTISNLVLEQAKETEMLSVSEYNQAILALKRQEQVPRLITALELQKEENKRLMDIVHHRNHAKKILSAFIKQETKDASL